MRILHVIPTYYPAIRYGGPIRSVRGLAAATTARGHEVHVFTTNVDGEGELDVPTDRPVILDGVRVHYFPVGLGRRLYRSPAMRRALARDSGGFDLIHIHSMWLWTSSAAAREARKRRIPYVLTPRGMLVREMIERKSKWAKRLWIALFDRRNIREAAAVHVTSAREAEKLAELDLGARRVAVIGNGVEAPPKELRRETRDPYILFVGRLSGEKGLDRLFGAMPMVESARLIVAGGGDAPYEEELRRLARKLGADDRIEMIGPVDDAGKWALIAGAKLLVLPSYSENFGLAAAEALALGRPVVVSADVGLAEAVDKAGAGSVAGDAPEAFAKAINTILADPGLAEKMGKAGLEYAETHLSWAGIAADMEALYLDCVRQERS